MVNDIVIEILGGIKEKPTFTWVEMAKLVNEKCSDNPEISNDVKALMAFAVLNASRYAKASFESSKSKVLMSIISESLDQAGSRNEISNIVTPRVKLNIDSGFKFSGIMKKSSDILKRMSSSSVIEDG